jgi:hypothetical protein
MNTDNFAGSEIVQWSAATLARAQARASARDGASINTDK